MSTVTLPFSALNNIPGVSGIEDVELPAPPPVEIADEIFERLNDEVDLRADVIQQFEDDSNGWSDVLGQGLEDALFRTVRGNRQPSDLLDEIAGEIAGEVDISGVTSEDIVEAVLEALDVDDGDIVLEIEGSLFATESDLVDLLIEAIEESDVSGGNGSIIDIGEILDPIDDVLDAVDGLRDDVQGLEFPDEDVLVGSIDTAVENALEDQLDLDILDNLEELADPLVDALVERLVSEEASESLQDTLDNL